MTVERKCKASLKSGHPCRYNARNEGEFCGKHDRKASSAVEKKRKKEAKTSADRGAQIALIISTSLALIEIIEKAVANYPTVLKLLELFREHTGNQWRYEQTLVELKAVAAYKQNDDIQALMTTPISFPPGSNNWADVESIALVVSIHNIALTHWASSTVLAYMGDGDFGRYGYIEREDPVHLSAEERNALLEIYKTCRNIPFIDQLRTGNFGSMWG